MSTIHDDAITKSRYHGQVCKCRMCGKYTKNVWEMTASNFTDSGNNTRIKTEEYALCSSCYEKFTSLFPEEKPVDEMSDKELVTMLRSILACK